MRRAGPAALLALCALALAPSASAAAREESPFRTIPEAVTISGIAVGGLTADAAYAIVRTAFEAPLVFTTGHVTLKRTPESFGAIGYVQNAVNKALAADPGTEIPVFVRYDGRKVRSFVAALARRFDRAAVDSRAVLRKLRPFITREVPGSALDRTATTNEIVGALKANQRLPIALPFDVVAPAKTRKKFGPVIVIRRGSNRLFLYEGARYRRYFRVATGSERYPTPLGSHRIVVKWRNPWWYPPDSDWARGQKPIPPGPGNPLGTRWMGLSAPLVGIHGTPDAASLGYSVSHGCIRMAIPEAEWLFRQVTVGTPVFIVAAK